MSNRMARVFITLSVLALLFATALFLLPGCGGDGGSSDDGSDGGVVQTAPGDASQTPSTSPESTEGGPHDDGADQNQAGEDETDGEVIIETAVDYAKENNPSLPELSVLELKVSGGWARVDLEPVDRSADSVGVLLQQQDGEWKVVGFGYLVPDNHPEAPPELFE